MLKNDVTETLGHAQSTGAEFGVSDVTSFSYLKIRPWCHVENRTSCHPMENESDLEQ